jgi:hypothetical protein
MKNIELLLLLGAGAAGNMLVVWAVLRHELAAMREEIRRAHVRIDRFVGVAK